jgi:putative FmdB family regulatory protein
MPIYQYACLACGHELEALQKINEEPFRECPECGEAALRKKVTAAAFRLKGSGWYETDFKHKSKPGAAADDKPAKKPEGDSSGGTASSGTPESQAAGKKTEGA